MLVILKCNELSRRVEGKREICKQFGFTSFSPYFLDIFTRKSGSCWTTLLAPVNKFIAYFVTPVT